MIDTFYKCNQCGKYFGELSTIFPPVTRCPYCKSNQIINVNGKEYLENR